jgi:hypothetical protein
MWMGDDVAQEVEGRQHDLIVRLALYAKEE